MSVVTQILEQLDSSVGMQFAQGLILAALRRGLQSDPFRCREEQK